MTKQEQLLNKYYKGETSLEEEVQLKAIEMENGDDPEKDIFAYYDSAATLPDNFEQDIFSKIEPKRRSIKMRLFRFSSAAAILLVLLSAYLGFRNERTTRMEDEFFMMEQALFQISESLQPPAEQEDMLVLWVDDNVEIIIN